MTERSTTVDKALRLLESLISDGPASLQQLAIKHGTTKTATHRILTTFLERGILQRVEGDYLVAPRMHRMATHAFLEIRTRCVPFLDAAASATGATALLTVFDAGIGGVRAATSETLHPELSSVNRIGTGPFALVIEERFTPEGTELRAHRDLGNRSGLAETPSGVATVAALSPAQRARLFAATAAPPDFQDRVASTARDRVIIERTPSEGVIEIAAPVRFEDSVAASVALLAPTAGAALGDHRELDLAAAVTRMTAGISESYLPH